MTASEKAQSWLSQPIDEETKVEIKNLMNGDPAVLEDAFYKDLEFGTGGMRGVMGIGSNRVNKYTFGQATQGLSNYMLQQFPDQKLKVAIAYDCRNNSDTLAKLVADILSSNGIEALLFQELRPTPELSFAVREHDCQGGIVITASHNPPEYNGFKVYWNDGAQVVHPHDQGIINEVRKLSELSEIKFAPNESLITYLDEAMDKRFIQESLKERRTTASHPLRIVFTSLHGTSITMMPKLLKEAGYNDLHIIEEQATPDGNFPTVESPNPEERAALDMALSKAKEIDADVVIGTDPDSDRIGVAVRGEDGEMMLLNGNQTGVLLTDYLLKNTELQGNEFIAYTIVSSDLFADVAAAYNVASPVCLTGFKHIAKLIRDYEPTKRFMGGGEESYGYMVGDFVRDKDAITSALIFCDAVADAKHAGKSIIDVLSGIYQKHGLYQEHLISITKKGKSGSEEIKKMMDQLRNNPPSSLGGEQIVRVDDILEGSSLDLGSGAKSQLDLPSSNVLQFYTEGGSKISARPSGTEPKIKFYFSIRAEWISDLALGEQQKILNDKIQQIIEDLQLV